MLRLRPYKASDAKYIVKWITDERLHAMWSANKLPYPLTKEALKEYQMNYEKDDRGWIFTAVDEKGAPVGHLLMSKADYEQESIHFGFIVVDPTIRKKGYGREMLKLAIKYVFEIMNMKKITLGVFGNNQAAHNCYKAVGFVDETYEEKKFPYKEERWDYFGMAIYKQNE
ncbi:MAG: GNAT family N-acetyltransferase [Clostridiales bacterium]|nr:GNAT family N-acetyltransferase [Clostridiales bacterium]